MYGEAGLGSELEIALVVSRHSHDGTGAVGHEDVVGDKQGHLLAIQAVDGIGAEGDARLLLVGGHAFDLSGCAGLLDIRLHRLLLVRGGEQGHQWVFRG